MIEDANWDQRVQEEADKMDLEWREDLQEFLTPAARRALGEYLAADILFHLDQMKKPGIMYRALREEVEGENNE